MTDRPRRLQGFTDGQRRGLTIILAMLLVLVSIRLLRDRATIADPMPVAGDRWNELASRLDPNVATATQLSAIPGLGEVRSRSIVEFRDRMKQIEPDRIVYRNLDDLMQVRGIGYAITRLSEPYLTFPEPTTQPARSEK